MARKLYGTNNLEEGIGNNDQAIHLPKNEIQQKKSSRFFTILKYFSHPTFIGGISVVFAMIGTFILFTSSQNSDIRFSHTTSFKSETDDQVSTYSLVMPTTTTTTTTTTTGSITTSNTITPSSSNSSDSISISDPTVINYSLSRIGYSGLSYFGDNKNPILNYAFLNGYDAVIEPGAMMKLDVFDDGDSSINRFRFTVCIEDGSVSCQHGVKYDPDPVIATPIIFECTPGAVFNIEVVEYNSNEVAVRTTDGKAICMYVRREIRSLSSSDLDTFIDTMSLMWTLSEEEGQELYGGTFHTNSYFVKFHHFNAAWQDSDHIHEGNGFLAQHTKMTNMFEKSLQSINSAISLPYWDFTIDKEEGKNAASSFIINSDLFGSMSIPKDVTWGFTSEESILSGAIPDGNWAYLQADINEEFDDLRYGYGYLRAPWNMNPSPYISRFTYDLQIGISLPTCSQHYTILQEETLAEFMLNIEDGPHATTHSLIGGIYGCDYLKPLLEQGYITDESSLKNICAKWIFYIKELYRYNYLSPQRNCTLNTTDYSLSECGYECDPDSYSLLELNLKNKLGSFVPSTLDSDGWTAWKDFICDGDGSKIYPGDHLESASPADPSFWVIHPTLERLLQVKFMTGGFEDESWPSDPKSEFVCSKSECYEESYKAKDYFDECCQGHYENDRLMDASVGNRTRYVGETNGEMISMIDPRNTDYGVNYIYDGFSWNHCTSSDFSSLIDELYKTSQTWTTSTTSTPSIDPTFEPSYSPSFAPSYEDTEEPSDLLTLSPTYKPTKSPDYTHKPTHKPTYSDEEDNESGEESEEDNR